MRKLTNNNQAQSSKNCTKLGIGNRYDCLYEKNEGSCEADYEYYDWMMGRCEYTCTDGACLR